MNFCRSRGLFSCSTILLLTLLFKETIAEDECIHNAHKIFTDLLEGGKNLLNFKYLENDSESVFDRIMFLIIYGRKRKSNKKITANDILGKLNKKRIEKISDRSTMFINNMIKGDDEGESLCAKALELCNLGISDDSNIYIEAEVLKFWEEPYSGKIIAPVILTKVNLHSFLERLEEVKQKRGNNSGNFLRLQNWFNAIELTEEETFQQTFSQLILFTTTQLRCKVKNSETKETTLQFYMFTFTESGYPKFILSPIPTSDGQKPMSYISSELLIKGGASSSTNYVKEEGLELAKDGASSSTAYAEEEEGFEEELEEEPEEYLEE